MWTIYMHKVPNGKVYIGVTSYKVEDRWLDGDGYKTQLFGRAIEKYGWENITHEILATTDNKEEAEQLERKFIQEHKSTNKKYGYNICPGGYVNSGFTFHHTEETKKKIGNSFRGKVLSQEHKNKISKATKGKIISNETREKLREIALNMDDTQKKKISESVKKHWQNGTYSNRASTAHVSWNKGLTKETNDRLKEIGQKRAGWKPTDDTRKKMSAAKIGNTPANAKKILCVETGKIYKSIRQAKIELGVTSINYALDNPDRTSANFHWRTYNEENNNK